MAGWRDGRFGSSARLLPWLLPDVCRCTLPIRQRQVTKQLTKKTAIKTKPKVKWYTMNVNIVLTKNYEDQQKPEKKQTQFIVQNPCF